MSDRLSSQIIEVYAAFHFHPGFGGGVGGHHACCALTPTLPHTPTPPHPHNPHPFQYTHTLTHHFHLDFGSGVRFGSGAGVIMHVVR